MCENSICLLNTHGIVTKTVDKTLPGVGSVRSVGDLGDLRGLEGLGLSGVWCLKSHRLVFTHRNYMLKISVLSAKSFFHLVNNLDSLSFLWAGISV